MNYWSCYPGYYLKDENTFAHENECILEEVDLGSEAAIFFSELLASEPLVDENDQIRMWRRLHNFNISYAVEGWHRVQHIDPLIPRKTNDFMRNDFEHVESKQHFNHGLNRKIYKNGDIEEYSANSKGYIGYSRKITKDLVIV